MKDPDNGRTYAVVFLGAAVAFTAALGYQVLVPFLSPIAWAIVLAVAFRRPWAALQRRMPRRAGLAAGVLTLAIGLLVLLPAGLLVGAVIRELLEGLGRITARLQAQDVHTFSDLVHVPAVARILDRLQDRAGISAQDMQKWAAMALQRATAVAPGLSAKVAIGLLDGAVNFFMTLFLLFFFLKDGRSMARALLELLPASPRTREMLGDSLLRMLQAIFRGSLLCALAQGTSGALSWWMAGLPLAYLAGAAMALFSILPLGGTALVWLPGSVWLWFAGHKGAALLLFGYNTVVTAFLADNVLRPLLIRGADELSTLVVVLGVFGGLAAFGLLGIFIGPVVLALAVAILQVLRAQAALAQG